VPKSTLAFCFVHKPVALVIGSIGPILYAVPMSKFS
jgi:hypothetical protein